MLNNASISLVFASFFFLFLSLSSHTQALSDNKHAFESLVKKDERKSIVVSEYGEISAINIPYGIKRDTYHIQFLTLEPNSLFLPAILNADMVFYVHTGSGRLSWVDKDEIKRVALRRGDIYRLQPGSVFQIQSSLENDRQKLRIYAIFTNTDDDSHLDPLVAAYSCIADLVRGFDSKTLQAAFKVPEEVIEAIKNSTERQMIVHTMSKTKDEEEKGTKIDLESRFVKAFIQNKKKKKKKTDAYNILDEDPDFKNSNGWSTTVTKKTTHLLKGSNVGVFMVNLTKGSMMGPHWNPKATEIAIVLQGQGMIRVVSSNISENKRFKVSEGDVFTVSRFHPMAQMSFNNETLVFMGFSTSTGKNHPQFLAGKNSVLQTLDKGVTNSTIDRLLASQADSVILECPSCAEEMEKEVERKREEEERRRREEEEERKRGEEEEEKRKREDARRRQEEEERRREEEEARRRQEEEEERRREEEEARRRQEEERRREEEERREQEEEEEEEEEEQRRRKEEEERKRSEEEWERKKRQHEEGRKKGEGESEQEQARRQAEERERRRGEEEEEREGDKNMKMKENIEAKNEEGFILRTST